MNVSPRKLALVVCLLAGVSNPANAQQLYECKFNIDGTRNWISSRSLVHIDQSGVHIVDGAINYYKKRPIRPYKTKRKAGSDLYYWRLNMAARSGQRFRGDVSKFLPDRRGPLRLGSNWIATGDRKSSRGSCKQLKSISKQEFYGMVKKLQAGE